MIIWNGLGFLVVIIFIAAVLFTEFAVEILTGNDQFYQENAWVMLIGMLIAAASTYCLHRLLLLKKGRVVVDKETGQEIVLRSRHSLFFIDVKWWPVLFVALGIVFLFDG